MNAEAEAHEAATARARAAVAPVPAPVVDLAVNDSPRDLAAEATILSEALNHSAAYRVCTEAGLEPQHFYLDPHRHIFRAMRTAATETGSTPNAIATWTALEKLGLSDPDREGVDRGTLAELAKGSVNAKHALAAVERVISLANERCKLGGALKVIAGVREPAAERKDALIAEGLAEIAADYSVEAESTSAADISSDFFDYLESDDKAEYWPLPWDELNPGIAKGYRRGQMTVLAGWSEMGKSWACDQILRAFAGYELKTGIFATEMEAHERICRHVTAETGIALSKLLTKEGLTPAEKAEAAGVLPVPFDFFEVNGWDVERICQQIIFGGYDVVAIDVVNLVPGFEERADKASRIVAAFTNVARRANCHVILVAHLNRERDKGAEKPRPVKRDLKNTGSLETHAHIITFIHRDQDEKGVPLPSGEIFLGKVRNGTKRTANVVQDSRHLTFGEDPSYIPDSRFMHGGGHQ